MLCAFSMSEQAGAKAYQGQSKALDSRSQAHLAIKQVSENTTGS